MVFLRFSSWVKWNEPIKGRYVVIKFRLMLLIYKAKSGPHYYVSAFISYRVSSLKATVLHFRMPFKARVKIIFFPDWTFFPLRNSF